MAAKKLTKRAGLKLRPTDDLRSHLKLSHKSGTVDVYHHDIVITEEVRLHLVWIHDSIFIKPLPKYLLSHVFWERILGANSNQADDRSENIRKAMLGFLRTYRYLIQYESDFMIARQDHLRQIPQTIQWTDF